MIKFIKKDFNNIREAFKYVGKGNIPLGIIILYYIVALPFGLLLYPIGKIWSMIQIHKCLKEIKELEEA